MTRRSSSSFEAEVSSDVEEKSALDLDADLDVDVEKGDELRLGAGCVTNETPVPGAMPVGVQSQDVEVEEASEEERHGFSATLDRVLSRTSTKTPNPGPPPDGGLKAWMIGTCPGHGENGVKWAN